MTLSNKRLWTISNSCSIVLAASIAWMWYLVHSLYQPNPGQLTSDRAVEQYLEMRDIDPDRMIPTGIFIQSLVFQNSNNIHLTGYFWQRYEDGDRVPCQIIFPALVESPIPPTLAYKQQLGDISVVGCSFEVTLRQQFNYYKYPFDRKIIRIRMWNGEIFDDRLLRPDLSSYPSTAASKRFGYDEQIVLSGWDIKETFFSYQQFKYDSNFGMGYEIGKIGRPELFFNIVLQRQFWNRFFIYFVPIGVSSLLLYITLLTITEDKIIADRFGSNTTIVLRLCLTIFFALLLAQVQIRDKFSGISMVYVEYFHTLLYTVILAVSLDSYLLARGGNSALVRWLRYRNNLLPKLLFWPFVLGVSAIVTLFVLEPFSWQNREPESVSSLQSNLISQGKG